MCSAALAVCNEWAIITTSDSLTHAYSESNINGLRRPFEGYLIIVFQ